MPLITLTPSGLYCEAGNFHIDPWRPVARAVITHAHGDHASWGHEHYLVATKRSWPREPWTIDGLTLCHLPQAVPDR